jgi:hypothetical protein
MLDLSVKPRSEVVDDIPAATVRVRRLPPHDPHRLLEHRIHICGTVELDPDLGLTRHLELVD